MHGTFDRACDGDPASCALLRLRVLLAADDVMDALARAETLLAVCTVTVAFDGAEALARTTAGLAFDLLIADLNLPTLSGPELLAAIRKRNPWQPIVVIGDGAPPPGLYDLPRRGDARLVVLEKPVCAVPLLAAVARAVCRNPASGGASCQASL